MFPRNIQAPIQAPTAVMAPRNIRNIQTTNKSPIRQRQTVGGKWRDPYQTNNLLRFSGGREDMGGVETQIPVYDSDVSATSATSHRSASVRGIETFHHADEEEEEIVDNPLHDLARANEQFPNTNVLIRRRGRPPLPEEVKEQRRKDAEEEKARKAEEKRIRQLMRPPSVRIRAKQWEEGKPHET